MLEHVSLLTGATELPELPRGRTLDLQQGDHLKGLTPEGEPWLGVSGSVIGVYLECYKDEDDYDRVYETSTIRQTILT
jgi:hypothetical protein